MDVLFVAGVTPIATDPAASADFYRDGLGLPLEGDEYLATERLDGVKHMGVWPLEHAARSCFGVAAWPADLPVPQATIEFELAGPGAVAEGAAELEALGHTLIHGAREEPWGQTVARLLGPEGLLIGLSYAPHLH